MFYLLSAYMTQTIQQKIADFNALPYEERVRIATNIIKTLAEKGNTQAADIYEKLQNIPHPSDKLLEAIYSDFENGIAKIKEGKKEEAMDSFMQSQVLLQKIRDQESAMEEDNPDDLLADL